MPTYTFLICNTDPRRDRVSGVQLSPGKWGRKEVPPRFYRVDYECSEEAKRWIARNCKWDPKAEQFVHLDTGDVFDEDADVIPNDSATAFADGHERDETLADLLVDSRTDDACRDLLPWFLTADQMRHYWLPLFFPHRKLSGGKLLCETAKYGTFADTRVALRAMSEADREKVLTSLPTEAEKYLRATCLAEDKAEYADYLAGKDPKAK